MVTWRGNCSTPQIRCCATSVLSQKFVDYFSTQYDPLLTPLPLGEGLGEGAAGAKTPSPSPSPPPRGEGNLMRAFLTRDTSSSCSLLKAIRAKFTR